MSQTNAETLKKPITSAGEFHERMRVFDARYVRHYLPIAQAFQPYAEQSKGQKLEDGSRLRGDPFDPDLAAVMLVRAVDLTGTSTRSELRGSDWFEKNDDEFADELGVSVHRLRAARRFLAGGVCLIEYRVLRLPNRVHYRALFTRINAFFSPPVSGWGQHELPLAFDQPARVDESPPGARIPEDTGDGKHNSECWKTQPGDAENATRSAGKRDSNKGNLYTKHVQTTPHTSTAGARAQVRAGAGGDQSTFDFVLSEAERSVVEMFGTVAGIRLNRTTAAIAQRFVSSGLPLERLETIVRMERERIAAGRVDDVTAVLVSRLRYLDATNWSQPKPAKTNGRTFRRDVSELTGDERDTAQEAARSKLKELEANRRQRAQQLLDEYNGRMQQPGANKAYLAGLIERKQKELAELDAVSVEAATN